MLVGELIVNIIAIVSICFMFGMSGVCVWFAMETLKNDEKSFFSIFLFLAILNAVVGITFLIARFADLTPIIEWWESEI